MKLNRLLLALVFWGISLFSNDFTISIHEYAREVSTANNINIYIDEDLKDKQVDFILLDEADPASMLNQFQITLFKLGYVLKEKDSIYYIEKKPRERLNNFYYKLNFDTSEDCILLLNAFGIKHTYLKESNSFILNTTNEQFKKIESHLKEVDQLQKQVMLKIMIFEHSDDNIEDIGVQLGSIYKDISGNTITALNSIISTINTNSASINSNDFYAAIRLLNENKVINIKQFPYILAKNNRQFKFEAVENIPYLRSTTTTEAANTSQQNQIDYKDVGLKIIGKSVVYDNYISLDLDLTIEDILTQEQNVQMPMPKTYKRTLLSNTNIKYNNVLLLSGIKRVKSENINYSIPFISKIPYLGELFKYENTSEKQLNITIAIEIIKSTDIELFNQTKHLNSIDYFTTNNNLTSKLTSDKHTLLHTPEVKQPLTPRELANERKRE